MKVSDINNFDILIEDAELQAETDFEFDFVSDIRDRYDEYDDDCFISEKQLSILESIANK